MCGNGWGSSPWGSTPWGIGNGWGSSWGEIPWGGGCPIPEVPTTPPIQLRPGWGARFERVSRQWQQRREQQYVLNVLFAIEGLQAKAKCGRPRIVAGTGARIQLRRLRHAQCGVGAVTVHAGSLLQLSTVAASCNCGKPEVSAGCLVRLDDVMASKGNLGSLNIRTIRNPTDEEILMMLAELV